MIKHRKLIYFLIILVAILLRFLYVYLRLRGILTIEENYIPSCIWSLAVCAIFFVYQKNKNSNRV